ncbi:hypothetical protein [Accumulibacter sp.]|uniref:Uncharacterized protein n=1 Tax=Accumulibacter regalis TaxID=522306 RepID=C7RJW3_ACCRE|nr:hypothetical protein [Accumulibacter sp.]MBN8499341.1 hypothetical protein [Accumulibacter sp.]MBO3716749.1 hypothetical protein [Accumulibacter sp.]
MNQAQSRTFSIAQTIFAVPVAIAIWLAVYTAAYMALGLLDSVRGLGDDWLQKIFRELFTPGVGGYVAILATNSWLSRANRKTVFWGFSVPVFLFMIGLPIVMIFFLPDTLTFVWSEQIIRWLGGAATLFGAWFAQKRIAQHGF